MGLMTERALKEEETKGSYAAPKKSKAHGSDDNVWT